MTIQLVEFATPLYHESIRLRDAILVKPLNLEFTTEMLSEEWNQWHLVAMDQNKLVGVLVLKPIDEDTLKMRQVAVMSELQGKGIGSLLVAESEKFARSKGFKVMELNARDVSIPFYESLSYEKVGEEFTEVNIPHFKMLKKL